MIRILSVTATLFILTGCSTIAEKALGQAGSNEVVNDQLTSGSFRVKRVGIYRVWKERRGRLKTSIIRASEFCQRDLKNKEFNALESFQTAGKPVKIQDERVLENFDFTINPLKKEAAYKKFSAAVGLKFNGLPNTKRVAENWSISGKKRQIPSLDEKLDADFIYNSIGSNCRKLIDDPQRFKTKGKPVFVYQIATGKEVYSKITGIPELSIDANFKGKSIGGIKLDKKDGIIYDKANNAVFGYSYFPLGKLANKDIPRLR